MKLNIKNIGVTILGVVIVFAYYFFEIGAMERFSIIGLIFSLFFFLCFGFLRFRYSKLSGEKEQELLFFIVGVFLAEVYFSLNEYVSVFLYTLSIGFGAGFVLALLIPKTAMEKKLTKEIRET
jgi:hypothetical protein